MLVPAVSLTQRSGGIWSFEVPSNSKNVYTFYFHELNFKELGRTAATVLLVTAGERNGTIVAHVRVLFDTASKRIDTPRGPGPRVLIRGAAG